MQPITAHPDNPRYFLFRGRPTVLVTSGEHYGAVLNQGFDYFPYLDELQRRGLNLTRIFSGAYVEAPGAFNIRNNTLAPVPGKFLCPWARTETPGYAGGGARFDLTRWDEAYFRRLTDFIAQAGKRGVVVELVLFCPYYEDSMWNYSPLKAGNNVNGIGEAPRQEVLTLKHPDLLRVQEALVRKLVETVRPYDNLYLEICNEPYFGGVTLEWQERISRVIREAETGLPPARRRLVAQNIANGAQKVQAPNPEVGLFNFHYASPPDAVGQNWDLRRAIGFDETGFKGTADLPYRREGWDFLLAGGSVYNHLDYSFTTDHPDGTAPVVDPTPGGGGPTLRSQLAFLKQFIEGLPFLKMAPDATLVRSGVPTGTTARALSQPGRAYAVYLKGEGVKTLTLELPAGRYHAEWVSPRTGTMEKKEELKHPGGPAELSAPAYTEDLALRLLAR